MREMTSKWQRIVVVFLALTAIPATPAQRIPGQRLPTPGVTATALLPITIEIVQACTVSAADLDFGAIPSNSTTPARGQTTITLHCGAGVTVDVGLDGGTAPGGNTTRRKLVHSSGKDRMDYGLYQDPGRTIHWGDRSGRDTLEIVSTGESQTVPVYGEIPAGQRALDGTYSDMITVTLLY